MTDVSEDMIFEFYIKFKQLHVSTHYHIGQSTSRFWVMLSKIPILNLNVLLCQMKSFEDPTIRNLVFKNRISMLESKTFGKKLNAFSSEMYFLKLYY